MRNIMLGLLVLSGLAVGPTLAVQAAQTHESSLVRPVQYGGYDCGPRCQERREARREAYRHRRWAERHSYDRY